ncbi:phytanoyl-CoA dioxygenase family protein [Dyadobacter sp. LHD-138]|uniref:phytanoyl-CoA dioxygenase family protein n=1 Tax=Dyadobacter sp. LHD-138 TaxID=3071413 RepID=UPI0027E124AE|nr:phytanoyl-CoA dioxygenase family protein [Dyadobacter sp. LHD-138]MDQ6480889.1 phytanoyl-CoA dioxygenase family protein [Dyadobacter sp. LHD-138]
MSLPTYSMNLPWIDSPFFYQELEQSTLDSTTKEQIKHYAERGYLILDTELPESTFDRIVEILAPHYTSPRLQDAWNITPLVKDIAGCPKVLDMLNILYRRTPFPFQTLNFRVGSQQKTHSDAIHFHSVPERFMCGVWVALEDIDETNGPLHYYPGSHKLPFYNMSDISLSGSKAPGAYTQYLEYENFVQKLMEATGQKKEVFKVKKGQALIWSATLFHGGEPILREGSSRHSQVTHYFFSDCMYYSPLWSDMPVEKMFMRRPVNILTGEIVENKYLNEEIMGGTGLSPFTDYRQKIETGLRKLKRSLAK